MAIKHFRVDRPPIFVVRFPESIMKLWLIKWGHQGNEQVIKLSILRKSNIGFSSGKMRVLCSMSFDENIHERETIVEFCIQNCKNYKRTSRLEIMVSCNWIGNICKNNHKHWLKNIYEYNFLSSIAILIDECMSLYAKYGYRRIVRGCYTKLCQEQGISNAYCN